MWRDEAKVEREHEFLTRRYFLRCAAVGLVGVSGGIEARGEEGAEDWEYLTKSENFRNVERHEPFPYQLAPERRRELGLERETWKLEVVADPESNSRLRRPMTKEAGTALDFAGLMKLAETRAVRFLKVMTCNNIPDPLGMGLWEGVPLRDVVWMAQPDKNVRRLYYHGYYDGDPKHLFQSSLSIGRVLEDPPGEPPVILCTKLNGEWLTGERGGPVRMIVPGAYGFKSIKWLTRVVLTNDHQANDTYAGQNNDIDSATKTFARFRKWPEEAKAGEALKVSGVAQCGM
ncbi:MAG: molybdopterin-dependent oxidoreductase, partial [Verrucomicrobiales bacterium]|nr:molybdopterin-dependent oxidoreductase [Verrucomicrobiales bacterium]